MLRIPLYFPLFFPPKRKGNSLPGGAGTRPELGRKRSRTVQRSRGGLDTDVDREGVLPGFVAASHGGGRRLRGRCIAGRGGRVVYDGFQSGQTGAESDLGAL